MKKIIGYTQGTFDMFHIGHLNLLESAKSRCDYLIVGVNSDELVKEYKNKSVIVPLDERIKILESIKFVDKVVVTETLDKRVHWESLGFHVLFAGNDWAGNARWEETRNEMAELGVVTEFLPYTKTTSSTILREKLLAAIPF